MIRINANNRTLDWVTIFIFIGLVSVGWLMLYASTYESGTEINFFDLSTAIGSQTIWIIISFIAFWLCLYIDWKIWNTLAYPIYGITLLLLIIVLIFGVEIKGATSWIKLGSFGFQPSELAKFGTCLAISAYVSSYKTNLKTLVGQLSAFAIMLIPAALILLQPDAGSALIFFSFLIVLYREGLPAWYYQIGFSIVSVLIITIMFDPITCFLIICFISLLLYALQYQKQFLLFIILGVIEIALLYFKTSIPETFLIPAAISPVVLMSVILWRSRYQAIVSIVIPAIAILMLLSVGTNYMFEKVLKPHQQDRINVWLKPQESDPQGALYNIRQSKTAIGSGGFKGKGFLNGIMTEGNHVPEQTTDFIFSTLGEEQGFIGVASVIILYLLLIYRIQIIGEKARNMFVRLYAYCVLGILFFHFFINIGMTMGLAPVIGIPLPFISKGGTSLFVFSIMIGILVKMRMSRLPD